MLKCILIYLWIYIGLFYMIEAGEDDEHVHIKLHMTSGQRKRAKIQQHAHQHHNKRQIPSSAHHYHHHHHLPQQQKTHPLPPPIAATASTNFYHDSPHNYLAGITATSPSTSSSLLVPQQHHVIQPTHTNKYSSSSSPLNLHESGQLINVEEDVFGVQGDVGGDAVVTADTDAGEHMMIPSYLAKNFALFPQPTTTYETEIIPHNSEGFNVVSEGSNGLAELEEENEIIATEERGKGTLESILLAEQMEKYQRYKPSPTSSTSGKTLKNEQLLQQLLQQQYNEKPELMNAAAYKSAMLRENKHRAEKDYYSEDDMTEAMMYASATMGAGHNPAHTLSRPAEGGGTYSGSIKSFTVDDIWSQLQKQYLNKYTPQAQALSSVDSNDQGLATAALTKTKPKRKRNIKRQRLAKPTIASFSTSWPAKTNHNRHKHQTHAIKQLSHYYEDTHLPPSAVAFSSGRLSSHRDADLYVKRPHIKLTGLYKDDDTEAESDEASVEEFGEGGEDDDFDVYRDESFEDAVYQRGKKFTGHSAYGHDSHKNHSFNYHDLYGSYSTPVTATVATNIQPSTFHSDLISTTLPSYAASTAKSFLPTLSHPSTSYQWRTQQNYPASYQTYHLHHQEHQPHVTATTDGELYDQQLSSALRLPKATIPQAPNALSSPNLSPTQSNDFTVSTSTSPSSKSAAQTPTHYKKRKNRIKSKRNRIVVI